MKVKNLLLLKKYVVFLCTILVALYCVSGVHAAKRYCRNSGNWNTTKTWSAASDSIAGASIPGVGDTVFIELGRTVTSNTCFASASAVFFSYLGQPEFVKMILNLNSSLSESGLVQVGGSDSSAPNSAVGSVFHTPISTIVNKVKHKSCSSYAFGQSWFIHERVEHPIGLYLVKDIICLANRKDYPSTTLNMNFTANFIIIGKNKRLTQFANRNKLDISAGSKKLLNVPKDLPKIIRMTRTQPMSNANRHQAVDCFSRSIS